MQRGFIKTVIIVIVAIAALAYFGFDISDFLHSEKFRHAIAVTYNTLKLIWNDFIVRPALWVWYKIIVGFVWEDVIVPVLQKIRS
ncbi:MAG: hypothetical protein Q8P52_00950 [bacterium]|nr:hypothetical protein [bacterium]